MKGVRNSKHLGWKIKSENKKEEKRVGEYSKEPGKRTSPRVGEAQSSSQTAAGRSPEKIRDASA